ncbi:MAG: mitochondrial inner membrane protein required for protein import [Claussenomyces sp. TS43310]|nr:MAG: mitochondrial inner membrane protein required for protein import [Claussenomyces sp. TS43310]
MLGRAVGRSLQTPTARLRLGAATTTTQWTRNLGSNHRRGVPKKPNEYQRVPVNPTQPTKQSATGSQRPSGAASAFGATRTTPQQQQQQQQPSNYSKQQDEVSNDASPDRNTTPQSEGGGSGAPAQKVTKGQESGFSSQQDEFQTSASPDTSESAGAPEQNQTYTGPLPDLTQGIPSTIEFELRDRSARSEDLGLDVTEESAQTAGGGGGGRGRGELPASAYVSSSERKRLMLANYMYAAVAVFGVASYFYFGRNWESEEEESRHPDAPSGWSLGLMWSRAKARTGNQLAYYHEPAFKKLLPDPDPSFERPYTLVLSLEDLLIHDEWSREHGWRMAKRPGVDYFLRYLSQYYEIVLFTSVPWANGEPIVRKLDPYHIITWPLYREATMYKNGEYVKDLSYLNRNLSKVIMIDTVASHAKEQPDNAIILPKWKGDAKDKDLVALIPFLEYIPTMSIPDVRNAIKSFEGQHIPTEFAKREAIARKRFEEQMLEERKRRPKSGLGLLSRALGVKAMPMTMQMEGEQSAAEAFAQGKMLQDQARERGQRNYEALEKMIREEGEKWLKEEAAHEEQAKQEGMKAMKSGLAGFFGVPNDKPNA